MNESSEILLSVQEIPMLYKRLFGKELDFHDMIELLPLVLRKTGGIATKEYLFKGSIKDFRLDLPCNVYAIEHVCASKVAQWYSSLISNGQIVINYRVDQSGNLGLYNPDATNVNVLQDEINVVYQVNKNVFTKALGVLINHTNDENKCLTFNYKELDVDVLYRGTVVDSDGYPKIPEKSAEAVAYFMNHVDIRMKYNMKIADGNMLAIAKQESNQAIAQARCPSSLSDNEIDSILNVMTSSNRKKHNFQIRQ